MRKTLLKTGGDVGTSDVEIVASSVSWTACQGTVTLYLLTVAVSHRTSTLGTCFWVTGAEIRHLAIS